MTDEITDILLEQEKQTNEEIKKYQAEHELVNEEFEKKTVSTMADGDCAVCKRKGITLFLTRKSILPKEFKSSINWSKGMAKLDTEPAINFTTHQYAYRMLREGFVYILLEQKDGKRCYLGYEVTASGMFRHKSIDEMATLHPKEIPTKCINNSDKHYLKGHFITIDSAKDIYVKAWIAYSHRSWSKKVREYYENLEESQIKTRFVAIDLKNVLGTGDNPRIFPLTDFEEKSKYLAELECSGDDIGFYYADDKVAEESNTNSANKISSPAFYSSSRFNSIKTDKDAFFKNAISSKPAIYNQDTAVVILDDIFGVAEELAISKRQNIVPLADQLRTIDKTLFEEIRNDYNKKIQSFDGMMSPTMLTKEQNEVEKSANPIIYDAKNTENMFDLDINKDGARYKIEPLPRNVFAKIMNSVISLTPVGMAKSTYDGASYICDYLKASTREEQVIDFYSEQLKPGKKEKLDYFSKEFSFRRQVKNCIGIFEQMKKNSVAQGQEDIRYVFYNNAGKVLGINGAKDKTFSYSLDYCAPDIYNEVPELNKEIFKINYPLIDVSYMKKINVISSKDAQLAVNPTSYGNCVEIAFDENEKDRVMKSYQAQLDKINIHAHLLENDDYPLLGLPLEALIYIEKISGLDKVTENDLKIAKVEKYIYPDTEYVNSRSIFNTEWKKYQDRLSKDKTKVFNELDKAAYQNVKQKIESYSEDHKNYIKWLYTKAQPTKETPVDEKVFWIIEVEANCSDAHLGYMTDILNMLDTGYLGDLKLDSEFDIWSNLISENKNLFTHVLMGDKGSLWQATIEQKSKTFEENQQLASVLESATKAVDLADKFFGIEIQEGQEKNTISIMQSIYQRVTLSAAGGIMRFPEGKALPNAILTKAFFTDSAMVTSDIYLHSFGAKVSYAELPRVMNQLQTKLPQLNGVDSYIFRDPTDLNKTYEIVKGRSGSWKIPDDITGKMKSKVITVEFVYAANSVQELNDLKAKSNLGIFDKGLRFFRTKSDNVQLTTTPMTLNDLHIITDNHNEIKKLDIEAKQLFVVQGATLILNYLSYQTNAAMIEDLEIPVHQKEPLRKKNRDLIVSSTFSAIQLASSLPMLYLGIKNAANIGVQSSTKALAMMKGFQVIGKTAGGIAAFIGVVDGFISCYDNMGRLNAGDSGALGYHIGSILEISSGILGLMVLAGISFPGVGWVILGLAVAGLVFKSIFEDESDNWDQMQWWLNRCQYGLHDNINKRKPYPDTSEAVYQCLSDFFTYVQGYNFFWTDLDRDFKQDTLFIKYKENHSAGKKLSYAESIAIASKGMTFGGEGEDVERSLSGKAAQKSGYIRVNLPDFVKGKSQFTISVSIKSKDHTGQNVNLLVNPDSDENAALASVTQTASVPVDISEWFIVDNQRKYLIPDKESYGFGNVNKKELLTSWYIKQKLCEINGNYGVQAFIHYYPNGKVPGEFPIIIEYLYNY